VLLLPFVSSLMKGIKNQEDMSVDADVSIEGVLKIFDIDWLIERTEIDDVYERRSLDIQHCEDISNRPMDRMVGALQMKSMRVMGWSLLACLCRSMLSDDGNDIDMKGGDGCSNSSNIGSSAVVTQDIIQKIINYEKIFHLKYSKCNTAKKRGERERSDSVCSEEKSDLGGEAMGGGRIKNADGDLDTKCKGLIAITFCVSLLSSCLVLSSNVGVKKSRSGVGSSTNSLSGRTRDLAAGVGSLVLSSLMRLVSDYVELNKVHIDLERAMDDGQINGSNSIMHSTTLLNEDIAVNCVRADSVSTSPPTHGSSSILTIDQISGIVKNTTLIELRSQVPEILIQEILSRLEEMMETAIRSEKLRKQAKKGLKVGV
jgi:hypothetical protein